MKDFIECVGNFANIFFEGSTKNGKLVGEELVESGEVTKLKGNKIPKGLVSLEHFFERKDDSAISRENDLNKNLREHDKVNIGNEENPKWILIGLTCS